MAADKLTGAGVWCPPSTTLEQRNGLWCPQAVSAVSYPAQGNDVCFQVEDSSYWFAHRNACIQAVVNRFPPGGMFYDIGGGNGFVSLGLQRAGIDVALLEPGNGARNAVSRGVQHVIWAALEDVGFQLGTLPAVGAFDVVEHIEDDLKFLMSIRSHLRPGGRFYCTVPAGTAFWSDEDIHAGHFRRYSRDSLVAVLHRAGLEVEFVSYFFAWLTPLVLLLRAVPFRIRGSRADAMGDVRAVRNDHSLPACLRKPVKVFHAEELSRLQRLCPIPFGTSLLCVARVPEY